MATKPQILTVCFFFILLTLSYCREKPFILDRVSQTYLPARYNSYGPKFCLGQASAEKLAYDAEQQILYIAGHKLVHVLDIEIPRAPIILGHAEAPGEVTDVAVCDGLVALSIAADQPVEQGRLQILTVHKVRGGNPRPVQLLFEVTVGVLPDMLLFTADCRRIIVANEGSPGHDSEGRARNPKGSVSIVDLDELFATDGDAAQSVKTVDFGSWDSKTELLHERGIRWGHRNGHLFSEDVEPEYLALSTDQQTLYVNLQENNAIATVDLKSGKIKDIQSLGLKPFGVQENRLDASDKDSKVALEDWPVYGLYQPDSILTFSHKNKEYLVTANEGESAWYDTNSGKMWSDSLYGSSIAKKMKSLPKNLKEALSDPSKLGRLTFSSFNTVNNTLVAFGSRSFSVFQTKDMKLVYDSKDELELLQSKLFPWAFNTENPESFCAEQHPSSQDVNIDTRRFFEWMDKPTLKKGPPPSRQLLMPRKKLNEDVEDAKKQLEEYQSLEKPWEYGLWKPTNSLTKTPAELIDQTSKGSGLSPESLQLAEIGNRRLLFVGNEKGNTIFVYDVTNPRKLRWHSAIYPGDYDSTFAELYVTKRITDIDPEGMVFIPVEDSPTGEPLLAVAGSLSGTVSIYRVIQLPPNYKAAGKEYYSRRKPGVLIPTNDPHVTLYVNSKLF